MSRVEQALAAWQQAEAALTDKKRSLPAETWRDVRGQLSNLVYPGFVTATGWQRLPDVTRYLRALEYRLEKAPRNPRRDKEWMDSVRDVQQRYRELLDQVPKGQPVPEPLRGIGWMIEELRVSYFAQEVRTAHSISEKRLHRAMDKVSA